ncbi:MAG: hydroxymethylbilane synthase [Dehalococcoidia bacterium]|nr:MAG: hydroxymethylbilane synthase [Dehalococcoidia bacterium]
MRTKIVVGSRGSRLALIQAESVAAQIAQLYPELEISISQIVTRGDRRRHARLDRMEGVGVFVKELEEALLEGRVDLAVHSLKDVPTQIPEGLCLRAVTERLDPRDVLVSRKGKLDELAAGAKIGTGSLRRAVQLKSYRPDLEALSIRGNVDTRLRKVAEGEFDGVILAAAALKRLGGEDKITEYLPRAHFLPAVGQGALVIETRLGDEEVAALVSPLNHLPTAQSVTAERAFLRALGGGCRAPIAALGMVNGAILGLEGMVARVSDGRILRAVEESDSLSPEELGMRLAQRLLKMGAAEFITEARDIENR